MHYKVLKNGVHYTGIQTARLEALLTDVKVSDYWVIVYFLTILNANFVI